MTCFWDSLRKGLNLGIDNQSFIQDLKINNKKTNDNYWNNNKLHEKELDENYEHINDFNQTLIYSGYDCSVSDPFLHLVCDIYNTNIAHNYNGNNMDYTKPGNSNQLYFSSNEGHFWQNGTESHSISNNRFSNTLNNDYSNLITNNNILPIRDSITIPNITNYRFNRYR